MSSEHLTQAPRWLIRLIWLAVAFALLRNLFPPNAFTATVLIFDYDHGVVRRGLIGSVLDLYWGETVSKGEVFAASAVITLLGIGALLLLLYRFFGDTLAGAKFLLLVVTSFAFGAIIASTGYIDLALIAVVALCLLVPAGTLPGVLLRVGAVGVGVFMHEVMLPYFAVFLVFDIWFARQDMRALPRALAPLLAGCVVFAGLTVWGQLPADQVQSYLAHIEAKSEFTAEPEATVIMERDLADNLAMMAEKRSMLDYKTWVLFDGLPLLAVSVLLIVLNLRLLRPDTPALTKLLLIGAILAPLSLNIIAFDVVRFGAVSVLVGGLAVLTQIRGDREALARLGAQLSWPVVVVAVVVNLNVTVNQMNTADGQTYAVPWAILTQLDWIR